MQPSAGRYASVAEYHRHTQIGWTIIAILGALIALLAWPAVAVPGPASAVVIAVMVLLAICVVLFASLTVIVDAEGIELRLGPGVIHRRVESADVETAEAKLGIKP